MRAGVDVRIDTQRDSGTNTSRLSGAIDAFELACGFGVDRLQSELYRPIELVRRLANAAEHDIGWREPSANGQINLANRVRVDAAAKLAQQTHDGERRVRLHRVVDAVRMWRERRVQLAVRLPDRFGAVDVKRRAMLAGDILERHTVAEERVVVLKEADHRGESYITVSGLSFMSRCLLM